ncbi:uncharacterized protein METZ01_LOCUS160523, partial [marine metagenome]
MRLTTLMTPASVQHPFKLFSMLDCIQWPRGERPHTDMTIHSY